MRTTITFDADVVAAIDKIRHERGVGVSEAVNDLIRLSLVYPRNRAVSHQETASMGLRIDVDHVAGALEVLEA